jgi:hypothetical protein
MQPKWTAKPLPAPQTPKPGSINNLRTTVLPDPFLVDGEHEVHRELHKALLRAELAQTERDYLPEAMENI